MMLYFIWYHMQCFNIKKQDVKLKLLLLSFTIDKIKTYVENLPEDKILIDVTSEVY